MHPKNTQKHPPLYREIMRHALIASVKGWRLWLFAFVAGLLQTGGILDVAVRALQTIQQQTSSVFANTWLSFWYPASITGIGALTIGLKSLVFVLILLAAFVCSVMAQGALVAGLEKKNSIAPRASIVQLIHLAGRSFWPLATLNILTQSLLWCSRFLLLVPLAYATRTPSFLNTLGTFAAFGVFLIAAFFITAIHLFALQAIIGDDLHLHDALVRALDHFRRAWLIVVEIAFLLVLFGLVVATIGIMLFTIGITPLFFFLVALALANVHAMGIALIMTLFILCAAIIGSFTITTQYAAWGLLYERIGERTATAKIHRAIHWLLG